MSKVNFFVTVPLNTPLEEEVYVTGSGDMLGNWEPGVIKLAEVGEKLYHIELEIPDDTEVEFKFTRGTWTSVEAGRDFVYIPNRKLFVNSHTDLYLNIENWEDLPDAGEAHTLTGNFRVHRNFHSKHMDDTRTVMVYLPPGYAYEEDPYPVLYLHDGQNVFDSSTSYGGVEWRVDEAAESLIKEGKIKKLIIAGIYNDRDRDDEYTHSLDPEEGTGGGAENYAKFIIEEVKPFIDSNYRTLPDAENTAIMGSSLGGLCSLYIGWKYPEIFSRIGVVSPSLWWDDRDIIKAIKEDENFRGPGKIWLDMGTAEGEEDSDYDTIPDTLENTRWLGEILIEKDYVLGENLFYYEAEGADHSEGAWSDRVEKILLWLFG